MYGLIEEEDIIAEQHRQQWLEKSVLAQFDDQISTITQKRGEIYGHPADDFAIAADLMKHFDHIESLPLRHSLRMICVKLARLTTTPNHLDSYVDIVGYARTAVMILEREKANG